MSNIYKNKILDTLRNRLGELHKFSDSQSLFTIGDNAARIYFRYSKVHPGGKTFFGLREIDLRQLEGHNSFICFLLDDGSLPIFIPYSDFEELFHNAQPAKDGQYKVSITSQHDALELYVARQGRFNVEGYVGFDVLERSLNTKSLREASNLSHSQVQTLIASIGHIKGYDIFVPENNVSNLDWSLTKRFRILPNIPRGFDAIKTILSEIDVIWVASGKSSVEGLFEIEHSTPIYSGLLRFNDVRLTDPNVSQFSIVSSDSRRELFSRQVFRPTFIKSGLAELVSFFEYTNIFDWHVRLTKEQKND
jgi:hypothetical protein